MASLAQWEWLLILALVLGLAVFELVSLRRSQRRDRERAARDGDSS
ncbi:MAG: hypothetical protein U1F10_15270 [Burkholderiales bacterium]